MNQLIIVEAESNAARKIEHCHVSAAAIRRSSSRPTWRCQARILNLAGLDDLALTNRPELKGAEEEIERGEKMHELADRNRKFPDFMVGWDYMRMPTEMKKDRYGAMVNITIPFLAMDYRQTQL